MHLDHRRASPVGALVTAEAELTGIDGARLSFAFTAWQGSAEGRPGDRDRGAVIAAGTIDRVLVDRAAFLARATRPAG